MCGKLLQMVTGDSGSKNILMQLLLLHVCHNYLHTIATYRIAQNFDGGKV